MLEALEDRLVPATLHLNTPGANGVIGGAIFQQGSPSGTGPLQPFLSLDNRHANVEQGYNTDARPLQFSDETSSPTATHALLLSDVPVVVINGVSYRQFVLEVNETGPSRVALDQLRLYVSNSANLHHYNQFTHRLDGVKAVYDLNAHGHHTVLLDARLSQGADSVNMVLDVPDAVLSASGAKYVYLYSQFATSRRDHGTLTWAVQPPPPASLSGTVYLDTHFDQHFDAGDPGIAFATVVTLTGVDSSGNAVNIVHTTDLNGAYSFTGLAPGTYTITVTTPPGYVADTPTTLSSIPLAAGVAGQGYDFGNVVASSTGGS
jgi:hypothetical protein